MVNSFDTKWTHSATIASFARATQGSRESIAGGHFGVGGSAAGVCPRRQGVQARGVARRRAGASRLRQRRGDCARSGRRERPRRGTHGALRVRRGGAGFRRRRRTGAALARRPREPRHRHLEPPAGGRRAACPGHPGAGARRRPRASAHPLHQRRPASLSRRCRAGRGEIPADRPRRSRGRLRGLLSRPVAAAAGRPRRRRRVAAQERRARALSAQRLLGRIAGPAALGARRRRGGAARRLPALRGQPRRAPGRILLCADGAEGKRLGDDANGADARCPAAGGAVQRTRRGGGRDGQRSSCERTCAGRHRRRRRGQPRRRGRQRAGRLRQHPRRRRLGPASRALDGSPAGWRSACQRLADGRHGQRRPHRRGALRRDRHPVDAPRGERQLVGDDATGGASVPQRRDLRRRPRRRLGRVHRRRRGQCPLQQQPRRQLPRAGRTDGLARRQRAASAGRRPRRRPRLGHRGHQPSAAARRLAERPPLAVPALRRPRRLAEHAACRGRGSRRGCGRAARDLRRRDGRGDLPLATRRRRLAARTRRRGRRQRHRAAGRCGFRRRRRAGPPARTQRRFRGDRSALRAHPR